MGIFIKKKDTLYDYLEKEVDKADIKAICSSELNSIKFMKLAIQIVSSYIASAISTCEFKIYDSKGVIKDTTYYKLNYAPNPNDTAARMKYNMVKSLIENGEALVVQYRNYLYNAESFSISNKSLNGYEFDAVKVQETLINKKFNQNTSFYFRFDDEKTKSLLKEMDNKYEELESCAMKAYKKAINNKWKLKIDSVKQHDPNFQKEFETYVQEQLKEFINGDSGVYPELNGYQLEHLDEGQNKTDSSDIREIRKDIFDMVAQSYKMPPSMMYGNMANLKEIINQFITFAVMPIASVISEEITKTLFTQDEILKDDKKVIVDVSTVNYRDLFDVAQSIDKLIASGVTNIDEIRQLIKFPLINTDYSKQHWMTKNYSKIEDVLKGEVD